MCSAHIRTIVASLGGKLTVFKLCNYGIMVTKVSHEIFGIVSAYFIVYEAYFVIAEFL
jgi:hypothetical protein